LLKSLNKIKKTLVMSNSNINAAKGRRYSAKEKADILAYVDKINNDKGRGGQSAASKKYSISPLTISSWIRAGVGGGTTRAASTGSVTGPIGKKLTRLQDLHDSIARAEKELAKMKSQFEALKSSL
jgi:transposase-like protein